jgi:hypothetical protein
MRRYGAPAEVLTGQRADSAPVDGCTRCRWGAVAQGLGYPIALGVHAGCLVCGREDVDLFGAEDGVEGGGVLVVSVARSEPDSPTIVVGVSRLCSKRRMPDQLCRVRRFEQRVFRRVLLTRTVTGIT